MPFSHEKLIVYQRSIELVAWLEPLLDKLPAKIAAKDQLDRASTSVPLNIAEGNGKFSMKDRARFFQMALGSGLECAARKSGESDTGGKPPRKSVRFIASRAVRPFPSLKGCTEAMP